VHRALFIIWMNLRYSFSRTIYRRDISCLIAMFLSVGCQPTGAEPMSTKSTADDVVTLDFFIPDFGSFKQARDAGLDYNASIEELILSAESCFSNAVHSAGVGQSLSLKLKLGKVAFLSESQSRKLPQEPTDLPFNHLGQLTRMAGCREQRYPVYLGVTSAVLPALSEDVEGDYRKYLARRLRADSLVEGSREWCELQRSMLPFVRDVVFRLPTAAQLHFDVSLITTEWSAKGEPESLKTDPRYFLHELLHVWGGLADRYGVTNDRGAEVYDLSNIMHKKDTGTCKLTPSQIEAIRTYRSHSCEREFLNPNKFTGSDTFVDSKCPRS
jgi:hypothetical protein